MVQRATGVTVRVVAAVLVAAGVAAAQAPAGGTSTVVLRDGRRIEGAQVTFEERTFVVRTPDGKVERLDEGRVLKVELGAPVGPAGSQAFPDEAPTVEELKGGGVRLHWLRPDVGHKSHCLAQRRRLPDGAWAAVQVRLEQGGRWSLEDPEATWPARFEYRLQQHREWGLGGVERQGVFAVAPARTTWVRLAGRRGDAVLVHVLRSQDERPLRHLEVRPGEPILVDDRPIGARVEGVVEVDGVPALRVAWEGLAQPELVRADEAFGVRAADQRLTLVRADRPPPLAADPARKVTIDLDDASQLEFARATTRLTGLDLALVASDAPAPVDLHLRSVGAEALVSLGAELLDKKLVRWCGLPTLRGERGHSLSERRPSPDGPLAVRLDGERLALWVSADGTFDLEGALELFRATTGIDVVVSTRAREWLKARTSPSSVFVQARAVSLAQALSLLTGILHLTWTTREDVVLVKSCAELEPEDVWLDLDLREGERFDALAAPLEAAGVELSLSELYPLRLPATKGRVRLPALLAGLKTEWRTGVSPVKLAVVGPAYVPGVSDLRALSSGRFTLELAKDTGREVVDGVVLDVAVRLCAGARVRLWADDLAAPLAALRAAQVEVVSVNNLPPPAVASAPLAPRTLLDWRRLRTRRPTETDDQLQAALEVARRRVAALPEDPEAQVAQGRATLQLLFRGDEALAAATRHFEAACASSPAHAEAWFHRGLCAALQESELGSSFAFAYFGKALEHSLGDVDVLLSRAQLQVLRGRAPDALADVEAVVRSAPGRADGWACMAQVRWSLGDREGALQAVGEALKLAPEHPDAAAWRAHQAELEAAPARGTLAELEGPRVAIRSHTLSDPPSSCVLLLPGGREVKLTVGEAYDGYTLTSIAAPEGEDRGLHLVFERDGQRRSVVLRGAK